MCDGVHHILIVGTCKRGTKCKYLHPKGKFGTKRRKSEEPKETSEDAEDEDGPDVVTSKKAKKTKAKK